MRIIHSILTSIIFWSDNKVDFCIVVKVKGLSYYRKNSPDTIWLSLYKRRLLTLVGRGVFFYGQSATLMLITIKIINIFLSVNKKHMLFVKKPQVVCSFR